MIRVLQVPAGELEQYYKFVREHAYDCPVGQTILEYYFSVYHSQKKLGDY